MIEIIFNTVMDLMEILKKAIFVFSLIALTVLALLPVELLTAPVFDWWDKAQHALAFVVLSLLGFAACPAHGARVVLGLVLYGVGIELAQRAVGWRYGEWQDVVADSVGVMLAVALRRGLRRGS